MNIKTNNLYALLGDEKFDTIYNGTEHFSNLDSDELFNVLYRNVQKATGLTERHETIEFINKDCTKSLEVKDRSLKGSIDVLLQPILRLFLKTGRYVSTSCCSGRIVAFENNSSSSYNKDSNVYGRSGRILYSSHCILNGDDDFNYFKRSITSHFDEKHKCYMKDNPEYELSDSEFNVQIKEVNDHTHNCSENLTTAVFNDVVLKFEAFLIHIECSSINDAKDLLQLCKDCGLKQSGIISLSKRVILAIRGISTMEAPILIRYYTSTYDDFGNVKSQHLHSCKWLVDDTYLKILINSSNNKLTSNFKDFVKFYWGFLHHLDLRNTAFYKYNYSLDDIPDDVLNYINGISDSDSYQKGVDKKEMVPSSHLLLHSRAIYEDDSTLMSLHRYNACVAANDRHICMFGGRIRGNKNSVVVYDVRNLDAGCTFKNVPENGPPCLQSSAMIFDGRGNFLIFGGRTSINNISNDLWIFQLEFNNWVKCTCDTLKPRERYRHSICLNEYSDNVQFYLVGGAYYAQPLDDGLLDDVWEANVSYTVDDNYKIISANVKWKCLHESTKGWCSGTLIYSKYMNSLLLVGGYTSYENFVYYNPKYIDTITAFSLDTLEYQFIAITSLNKPLWRMGHMMVKVEDEEYLIIGGLCSHLVLNDIWYLNIKYNFWYYIGFIPGIQFKIKASAHYIKDKNEIVILGGGIVTFLFHSFYDNPVRIKISMKDNRRNPTNYVICNNKKYIKAIKTFLESEGLYDKNRKIVMKKDLPFSKTDELLLPESQHNSYGDEYDSGGELKDEDYKNTTNWNDNESISQFSTFAYIPVVYVDKISFDETLNSSIVYNNGCCVFDVDLVNVESTLGIFDYFNDLISYLGYRDVKLPTKYIMIGDCIIFSASEFDERLLHISQSLYDLYAKLLGVKSIALMDEVFGEKRIPKCRILTGTGNVKHKENGVYYVFNVAKNMFSSGNCSERIRIPKTYFQYSNRKIEKKMMQSSDSKNCESISEVNVVRQISPLIHAPKLQSGEIIVDLYCGIGYFVLPLLKYTTEDQVKCVFACDINPDAIKFLNCGIKENGINPNRIITHVGNSNNFGVDFGFEYTNNANRVILGLLPSSEGTWNAALRAIDSVNGGIIHVHGVSELKFTDEDTKICVDLLQECNYNYLNMSENSKAQTHTLYSKGCKNDKRHCDYAQYVLHKFHSLCLEMDKFNGCNWSLELLQVVIVKHYSPHKYHFVVDLAIRPL